MFADGSVILRIVYVVGVGEGTLLGHSFIKINDFFLRGWEFILRMQFDQWYLLDLEEIHKLF